MVEKTFAILKPDVVAAKQTGKVIDLIEQHGFTVLGIKKVHLKKDQVELFYDVHRERPFFKDMVGFMTSGPVVLLALSKENGIAAWRDLMGATNPANAAEGTVRKSFGGKTIDNNAVHGSDAQATAARELAQFFPEIL